MAEDITTPDHLVIQGTPVTQAQFNTQIQVINSFKKVINEQFTNLNYKATERVLRKFKLIEFYRRCNENQYHFNKGVHVEETFHELSDELEKITPSDVRGIDSLQEAKDTIKKCQ